MCMVPGLRLLAFGCAQNNPPRKPAPQEKYDKRFLDFAIDWVNTKWDPAKLPASPVGDAAQVSAEMLKKYTPDPAACSA